MPQVFYFAQKRLAFAITGLFLKSLAFSVNANAADAAIKIDAPSVDVEEMQTSLLNPSNQTLNGLELSLRREATLGETLNDIPGFTSSYFGPNASRPVIRGMEGERAQIMQNGSGVMDASSVSPDHAVGVDPMVAEQIEVIRGPASLIYGGGNVGGVINVTDHRIPKESLSGIISRGEAKYGGADNERSGVAVVDLGNGDFSIHADAYKRKTDDLEIPKSAAEKLIKNGYVDHTNNNRLLNSAGESDGGAIGASMTFDNGYTGISFARSNSFYGTVADPNVQINMTNDRWDFASELFNINGPIKNAKVLLTYTDYQHQEIESGTVGTSFLNRGIEGRLEAGHANIGDLNGLLGFQFSNLHFEAIGSEAFMPATQTEKQGIYIYEELPIDKLSLSAAGRLDNNQIHSAGGAKFGSATTVDFIPINFSVTGQYAINSAWKVHLNLAHSERSPAASELFAHGAHLATNQYQIGNAQLSKEISNNLEIGLYWKTEKHSANFNAYYNRFNNFITSFNTGNKVDENGLSGGTLSESIIKGLPAEFKGIEAQAKFLIYEGSGNLDLNLRGDYVEATDVNTGKPLPRIAPMRLGAGLEYQLNQLRGKVDMLHGFKQDRLADNETATDAYTLVLSLIHI